MKKQSEEFIKIKVAISLRTLLKRNKKYSQEIENNKDIVDSYEKIAVSADVRKATVTLAFNGTTRTAMTTIILIVEAMGYKITEFATIYNEITDEEINNFKLEFKQK